MIPEQEISRFGGGGGTELHPFALLLTALAIVLILVLPRKYAVVPFLVITFFLPLKQQLVIAGVHFMLFRILLIFAWLRVGLGVLLGSADRRRLRMNSLDRVFLLWALSSAVTFVLLWQEWGAVINRLGLLYNAVGVYFFLRLLYQDEEDVDRTTRVFAMICAVIALCMLNEQITGRNFFSIFGGVHEFSLVREDYLRAQGPFAHPILAGAFGAMLLPLFVGLGWQKPRHRFAAAVGIVSATVITFASASSTPVLAYAAGLLAMCLWPFRRRMRWVRWGTLTALVGLHLVMKAPVWALIGRVDVVGGSSSYQRYELVNQAIRHFEDWWLLGMRYPSTWGWEMGDTTNQYVDIAVTGGIVPLVLFVAVLVCAFKGLGTAAGATRDDRTAQWRLWALGSALFAALAAFFGVVYFDQTSIAWYTLLAMISTAGLWSKQPASATAPAAWPPTRRPARIPEGSSWPPRTMLLTSDAL